LEIRVLRSSVIDITNAETISIMFVNQNKRTRGRGLIGKVFKTVVPAVVSSVPTLLNRAVDALPVELHLPGYRFCGPGTKLEERLSRGERGINQLDDACREHDIAYAKYKDNQRRRVADRILAGKAWERVKAWNSGVSERAYAAAVAATMKAKSALGSGMCCGGGRRRRRRVKRKTTTRRKPGVSRRGGGSVRKRKVTRKRKTARGLYLRPYRKN
jgi:hypothetical protein